MSSGSFTVSLDTEIAWGWLSFPDRREQFYPLYAQTRPVIDRLLTLFDRYEVPATWAIVGRLLEQRDALEDHQMQNLSAYFPNLDLADVYEDSRLNSIENSWLSYPSLIDRITSTSVSHDIGTHTYNHLFLNDVSDESLFVDDLQSAKAVMNRTGAVAPTSLVFPRNQVRYLDAVVGAGIRVVRTPNQQRYSASRGWQPLANKLDQCLPTAGLPVTPERLHNGLTLLPGSQLFRISNVGLRRFIPFSSMINKCRRGMDAAADRGACYHIWFHPFNFAYRLEEHFAALEAVLRHLSQLREQGTMEVKTMRDHSLDGEHNGG